MTWPSREETVRSTIVVVVFSVVLAGALGFYDYVWAGLTRRFIFSEG
ncbi:MAG: preprotein translocase subunit SecE [bacterium]